MALIITLLTVPNDLRGCAGGEREEKEKRSSAGGRRLATCAQRAVSTAGRKFEATTEQLKGAGGNIAMGGADAKPQKIEEKARPVDQPQQPGEGMSRLMQAKKKAREGMEDE